MEVWLSWDREDNDRFIHPRRRFRNSVLQKMAATESDARKGLWLKEILEYVYQQLTRRPSHACFYVVHVAQFYQAIPYKKRENTNWTNDTIKPQRMYMYSDVQFSVSTLKRTFRSSVLKHRKDFSSSDFLSWVGGGGILFERTPLPPALWLHFHTLSEFGTRLYGTNSMFAKTTVIKEKCRIL